MFPGTIGASGRLQYDRRLIATRIEHFSGCAFCAGSGEAIVKMRILLLVGFAATLVSASAGASAGNEQAFIGYFSGTWAGSATVVKNSIPWR